MFFCLRIAHFFCVCSAAATSFTETRTLQYKITAHNNLRSIIVIWNCNIKKRRKKKRTIDIVPVKIAAAVHSRFFAAVISNGLMKELPVGIIMINPLHLPKKNKKAKKTDKLIRTLEIIPKVRRNGPLQHVWCRSQNHNHTVLPHSSVTIKKN